MTFTADPVPRDLQLEPTLLGSLETGQFRAVLSRVSVIIVNYNGGDLLQSCIRSVFEQDYPDFEVILVDNDSQDGSLEAVQVSFPQVRVIRSGSNLGFAQGNNLGAYHSSGEYLAFLNPDTTVEPDWLLHLVTYLQDHPEAGLVTPKILILDQPQYINTCGNLVHFTGIPSCRGWMHHKSEFAEVEQVCSISGAAFVIRKSIFEEIGGFDGQFFMYAEDTDLSWRARLAGYRCFYIPQSIIYHRYAPVFGPDKYFHLERNRYKLLLKNLRLKTLFLLTPALLLTEIITCCYAILHGNKHIVTKIRTYDWLISHLVEIRKSREIVQEHRYVKDQDLLELCSYYMIYSLPGKGRYARIADYLFTPLFFILYKIINAWVRW